MSLKALFEKTVFLLGAGASTDAGCLSSNAMLADLKKNIAELPPSDTKKTAFQGIFDFVLASLNFQHSMRASDTIKQNSVINIEDFIMVLRQLIDREFIIPAPLIGNWNNKIVTWEVRNEDIFAAFLSYATNLLMNSWTRFEESKAQSLLAPFRSLIELSDAFEAEIFTLNYDLTWESSFNTPTERLIETGFSAGRWVGDFEDPENVAKLRLSKLHGSVDWYFDEATEEVRIASEPVDEPLVIFGSSYKMQSFDPFISLLSRFRQCLQTSSLYVIVGYSFQDRYINNILIQSLGSQLARSAIVVDPTAWESAEHLTERVEETQASKSLNEMLNLKYINPERVEIVKSPAESFYAEYLKNTAEKLSAALAKVEEGEPAF